MARIIQPLWRNWLFSETFHDEYRLPDADETPFLPVMLPHTVKEVPYNYFDENMYQLHSCYRKHIIVPQEWQSNHVFIDFEGVMCFARVFVNGFEVGTHRGGYTPFSFEITGYIRFGSDNVLTVEVDSRERDDIPPFGFAVDYLTYGGIYRDVTLRAVPPCFIQSFYAQPVNVRTEEKTVDIAISLVHTRPQTMHIHTHTTDLYAVQPVALRVHAALFDADNHRIAETALDIVVADAQQSLELRLDHLTDISLWTLNDPVLYRVEVSLLESGRISDCVSSRIGFRTAEFTPQGFFLNGTRIPLRGLNRHQSFPYVGYAMPKRVQQKDADILKHELGITVVRTSHYPQSSDFLDRCDEIGLLVFEEIPGWQHIGNEAWQEVSIQAVREMITRDRHHPSIILWGVRINESGDSSSFYQKTNALAHALDPHRQTGGVRCIDNSELLEDVYTMNDFVYGSRQQDGEHTVPNGIAAYKPVQTAVRCPQDVTGLDQPVPYLITEFAGHIYPTKRFDQEERLITHAAFHLNVQNAAALNPYISGAIGWCAFDYNTHANFGSGDRICYHGVMDMFRLPKFAAHVYASQIALDCKPVLEPLTRYTVGDRAIGGIVPLMICTNCDSVRIIIDDKDLGLFYPAFNRYTGLEHPPVILENSDFSWGQQWSDAECIGYRGNTPCINRRFVHNPVPSSLFFTADDMELSACIPDATRCTVKLLDAAGNELPYSDAIVTVTICGPAVLIGPSTFALIGGVRSFWIKTLGKSGTVQATVSSPYFPDKTIIIAVIDSSAKAALSLP